MNDVMSLEEFQKELRRNARFQPDEPTRDILDTAVRSIADNPSFASSRLLRRVVRALSSGNGEFRRAEASAFDAPMLRLVVGLLNAARGDTHTRAEWLRAAAAADLACDS
jgi:hypothetical protein